MNIVMQCAYVEAHVPIVNLNLDVYILHTDFQGS